MSNTQDIHSILEDEALDAQSRIAFATFSDCAISDEALDAPVQQAVQCRVPGSPACFCAKEITGDDEALDPAPAQQAFTCVPVCAVTIISDEALDPPMQNALTVTAGCGCSGWCQVSDEALDEPKQHALACAGPYCRSTVISEFSAVSDEALDPAPAQQAEFCSTTCIPCAKSDEMITGN